MTPSAAPISYTCARCLRASRGRAFALPATGRVVHGGSAQRYAHTATVHKEPDDEHKQSVDGYKQPEDVHKQPGNGCNIQQDSARGVEDEASGNEDKEEGALTRRLRAMSEEALESGGHGALKAVQEAGFSDELKAQLEQRIAAASVRSVEADLPTASSRHARDLATAEAWTGTESIHDASLRMLNDAHKPMRLGRPPRPPGVQMPKNVDTGRKRSKEQRGLRLANARDRSGLYASFKDDAELEAADREKRLQELKDRFEPHGRAIVPGSVSAIASLANKRIEDAIARGQFKNLPRGKGMNVERDYNASSPFIDTTEYFMNKIIQKQEIVPPWIEKQQELTSAASKFRTRLRADWKRHAARMISSKGGSLQDQMRRAEAYAKAELLVNPIKRKQETLTAVDEAGHASQISISGELKLAAPSDGSTNGTPVLHEEIVAQRVTFDASPPDDSHAVTAGKPRVHEESKQTINVPLTTIEPVPPAPYPFRDPDWERIESAYHNVAIKDLNSKARSYNLQAPELAKRPYFNLQRELNSCFADVAPQVAQAILDRTRRPPQKMEGFAQSIGEKSVFGSLGGGPVRIRDERSTKQYGFKQFWNDLWAEKS